MKNDVGETWIDKRLNLCRQQSGRNNLKGDATEFAVSQAEVRKNEPYAARAARTNKMLEEQYQPAFISVLDFETARKYRKDAGDYLRTNQWDDKVVKVFIRK